MKLFSASLWAGHRNSLCIFLARLVWLESVANEVCAIVASLFTLSCGVTRLCINTRPVQLGLGVRGREPGVGHAAHDESPGGNVSRTLQPGQPWHTGDW